MNDIDRETEERVWEIGPEKFARKGHNRCTYMGSTKASGIVWVETGTSKGGTFTESTNVLCTCVRARVRVHGLTPVRRLTTRDDARKVSANG